MTKPKLPFFIEHISHIFIGCFTFAILMFLAFQIYFENNLTTTNLYSANLFLIIFFILIYGFFLINILEPFNFIIGLRISLSYKLTQIFVSHIYKKINNTWMTKNCHICSNFSEHKKAIYFMFYILPKIIFSIALFIDIVCLNKIHYLYLILTILWIPLLFHITLYIFLNWALLTKKILNVLVEIEPIFENNYLKETKITPIIPEKYWGFTIKECSERILAYLFILMNGHYLNNCSQKFWVNFLNLIIYTMFFLIWSYVLYLKIM